MPAQAGLIDRFMSASKIEILCDFVKQHPVYSLIAVGSVLGLAYLYNHIQEQKIIFDEQTF